VISTDNAVEGGVINYAGTAPDNYHEFGGVAA